MAVFDCQITLKGGGVILFNNNSGWSTEAVSSKGVDVGKCIGKFQFNFNFNRLLSSFDQG